MDADETNITRLTYNSDIEFDHDPTWSPDGTRIAFSSFDKDSTFTILNVMNADGTNITRLTDAFCHYPAWSPDGKYIAVVRWATGIPGCSLCNTSGIYLIDADGSNMTLLAKLTIKMAVIHDLAWSPDGKHIAFASNQDAPVDSFYDSFYKDIYSVDVDSSNITRLTHDGQGGFDLTWSPDGQQIAFSNYNEDENKGLIYIMNADGSNITKLTVGSDPSWQP